MYLDFCNNDNYLLVKIMGELDHHTAEEVRSKIDDRLDRDSTSNLIMDFSGVSFMDSSGIGVVIGRYKKLNSKGGNVAVINVKGNVQKVFELSGIYKIIKGYDSLAKAVDNI